MSVDDERARQRARTEAKKVVRRVAVELFGVEVGCYDGGCLFGHPGGMQTNGGCGCIKTRDLDEMRRNAQMLQRIAVHLALSHQRQPDPEDPT